MAGFVLATLSLKKMCQWTNQSREHEYETDLLVAKHEQAIDTAIAARLERRMLQSMLLTHPVQE